MKHGPVAAAVVAAGLLWPQLAAAHVDVTPTRVAPGSSQLFVFSTPNERTHGDLVGLEIEIPSGFVLAEVEARPGWTATVRREIVTWRGGRIPPGQFETFSLDGATPARATVLRFRARELFADGTSASSAPSVRVVRAAAAAPPGARDRGARTLGEFALAIAIGGAAAAVLLGFGLLALWLLAPWERHDAEQREQVEAAPTVEVGS